jgi:hypothetical protein
MESYDYAHAREQRNSQKGSHLRTATALWPAQQDTAGEPLDVLLSGQPAAKTLPLV